MFPLELRMDTDWNKAKQGETFKLFDKMYRMERIKTNPELLGNPQITQMNTEKVAERVKTNPFIVLSCSSCQSCQSRLVL
jgi:hypothetical protein